MSREPLAMSRLATCAGGSRPGLPMIDKARRGIVTDPTPFAGLSPEVVLDAAESAGFAGGGRLLALNSYENRVYQLETPGGLLALKFYRALRWSDEQITEEHEFTA